MARRDLLTALAVGFALAAALPSVAQATTCVKPGSQGSPAKSANVVFDGVVLSGPRLGLTGDLLSPAHMQVLRYVKGHGPRVVRVATSFTQGSTGLGVLSGTFTPEPGEVYRIFGRTPRGAGSSTAHGVLEPSLCGGFRRESSRPWLHTVSSTVIRAHSPQGGAPWTAEPLRGPGGLECIRFQPANKPAGTDRSAECTARPRSRTLMVGIATTSQGPSTSTSVVVAGPKLRRVSVQSPDGSQQLNALGRALPTAVGVFHGFVDPTQLELVATLAGGRRIEIELSSRRADVPDPDGQAGWAVYGQDAWPPKPGRICTSVWQLVPDFRDVGGTPLTTQDCGSVTGPSYWFAIRTVTARPPLGAQTVATRTIVTGAIGPAIKGVTVTAHGTSYPVGVARFGRAFVAVLPQGTQPGDIAVSFAR